MLMCTGTATPTPLYTYTPTATPTFTPTPTPTFVLRINAGGAAYTDSQGKIWQADQAYASGTWGYVDGQKYSYAVPISNTIEDKIYQSVAACSRVGCSSFRRLVRSDRGRGS